MGVSRRASGTAARMHSSGWTAIGTTCSLEPRSSVKTSNQFDSFASLDTNRSGTLTPDEWKWTTRSFARYDTDRDGLLTRR